MSNNVFGIELPLDTYIMEYPEYNNDKDKYFVFRPFFEGISGVGAEVGTFEGYNALGIVRFTSITKLYCIDPYKTYNCIIGGYMSKFTQEDWDEMFELTKLRLKDFPVEFIRQDSVKGAELVPNDLDFAYLDGDHATESVLRDIKVWFPKVKIGGRLGGHDFVEPEVRQAVAQWVYENKEYANEVKTKWNDWWLTK